MALRDTSLVPKDPAYQAIFAREEQVLAGIRDGLITDPLIDLIKADDAFWNKYSIPEGKSANLVGGNVCSLLKNSWIPTQAGTDIGTRLHALDKFIVPNHSVVAGGAVFSALFGLPINDVDIFFVGTQPDQATAIIRQQIGRNQAARSENSVSTRFSRRLANGTIDKSSIVDVQYILRLYRSISEVIHGFDVDCCCMAYDGNNVWITPRAYYSMQKGYNSLNKERLSPSYEYRMLKYAYRGMPILIPGFDYYEWKTGAGSMISKMGARNLRKIIMSESKNNHRGFRYVMAMAQMLNRFPKSAAWLLGMHNNIISDYVGNYKNGHPFDIEAMMEVLGDRYDQFSKDAHEFWGLEIWITGKSDIVSYVMLDGTDVFRIPDDVFEFIQKYYTTYPPQNITYKVVNPGEQATGSFHKIVLDNTAAWWNN